MTDAAQPQETPAPAATGAVPARSRKPLLIGLVLALLLGGGGFFVTFSGLIPLPMAQQAGPGPGPLPDIAFVAIEPLLISLSPGAGGRHLRFAAELEVARGHQSEVAQLMPRVRDVLNGYLRAVAVAELEDPSALVRLRAQMLRRVQMVTGEGRVRDLLVTEFVLN